MRSLLFPLGVGVALVFAISSPGSEKPRRAQGDQSFSQKVWTNSDIDELREQGLISIVGPEVQQPTTQTSPPAPSAPTLEPDAATSVRPIYNSRLDDPEWYAENAAYLQAELASRETVLREQQMAMALAPRGITQPGIALDKPSYGVTPQEALANLQAQVTEMQDLLDQLSDLARAHNIPPGVFRVAEPQGFGF